MKKQKWVGIAFENKIEGIKIQKKNLTRSLKLNKESSIISHLGRWMTYYSNWPKYAKVVKKKNKHNLSLSYCSKKLTC